MTTLQHISRIGFCCKFVERHPKKGIQSVEGMNTGSTTVAWLSRQKREAAERKLWDLMTDNIRITRKLVRTVSEYQPHQRMLRIGSDILPMYTHADWKAFWRRPDVVAYCEREFATIGELARERDVRLSFHPGQYCVLASETPDIVNRSIEDFEYHADMVRWMGYGNKFQEFKINVHIAGRAGAQGMRAAYARLSPEARNCITIENEEMSHGLDACLTLADLMPIVLDIHHHYIHSGEYIKANDDRIKKVIDSWRGVRPTLHFSQSREDVLINHSANDLPDLTDLLSKGYKKQKLRAHSDFMWNHAVNDWASQHWEWADIMVEAKAKNLASSRLCEIWKK
jgi:UV DNA damage repair endonuclease